MLCYGVAGGCNCSRSNLTGALLGAYFGLRHPNSDENEDGNSNSSLLLECIGHILFNPINCILIMFEHLLLSSLKYSIHLSSVFDSILRLLPN